MDATIRQRIPDAFSIVESTLAVAIMPILFMSYQLVRDEF